VIVAPMIADGRPIGSRGPRKHRGRAMDRIERGSLGVISPRRAIAALNLR